MNAVRAALAWRLNETWNHRLGRVVSAAIVLGLGVVLGMQYMNPNSRVIGVMLAIIVIGIAWRLDIVSGIGVMLLALPFPRGTAFGSTNLALILLLLVIFLLRAAQREIGGMRRTPVDVPVVGLVLAYMLSFYNLVNLQNPTALRLGFWNTEMFFGTVLMFYLVQSCVSDERALRRLHLFQLVTLVAVLLVAVWELVFPGKDLIPGLITFSNIAYNEEFQLTNLRVGSSFHDYELLADFCGLNLLFLMFRLSRARTVFERTLMGLLLGLDVFILFATVTRGPFVALGVVFAYMVWRMRRHLRVVPTTLAVASMAALFIGMNFFVANFTHSGDLAARMSETYLVGLVPDSRVLAWTSASERFMLRPIIGSGPAYVSSEGIHSWYWPHNLYLYIANIVGLVGLSFFLWMMGKYIHITRTRVNTFSDESYVDSYLFVARLQCIFFLVDQSKIEYLRNSTYQFMIWPMFALWVAADRIRNSRPAVPAAATWARASAAPREGA